ncbi:flippase [Desulfotignum balticum]|uniref:flippase n=1 Tax=Desulfotignum balticum TaxID=115781 RepID=UPI00046264A7|nr:flippase [Desulfotignum balticum]
MQLLFKIKQAFHHQGFKKYSFNTGWLMADKVLRLFVGLFVGVYVARYLGPEKFGILSFAMSFVALFGAFAKLGLDGIVVRNAVQNPDSRDELLGTAFGLRVIGGLILLCMVFGAIRLIDSDRLTQLIVMIIAVGHVLQAFQVIEFYFQSQVLARLASIAGIAGLITSSVIKLTLIWSGASLIWFAWVVVVEHGLKGIILSIVYVKQRIPLWHWRFRFNQVKLLLRDSWTLIFSGLAIMIYMRIDQVMIKQMLNNEAVGNYAAAVRISEVWLFITVSVTQSLMPSIVKAKAVSEAIYLHRLLNLYRFLITIALAISILITLFSDIIVTLLFGDSYNFTSDILKIYVWSTVFVYMNNVSWQWFLNENLQHIATARLFIGALLNVIFNYIFIVKYGTIGAAWATLFSYFFATYFGNLIFKKTRVNFKMQTIALLTFYKIKDFKL